MNKTLLATVLLAGGFALASTPATAQRLLTQSQKYGDAHELGNDQLASTTTNFYNAQNLLLRSSKVTNNDVLQEYGVYTYDDNGNQVQLLTRIAKATSPDNVDNEYSYVDGTRATSEYDAAGNKIRYYEAMWRAGANYWQPSKGWERDYNADGSVAVQREWISQYNPDNPGNPQNTTSYTYANGQLTLAHNDGAYDSNRWEETYTYDAEGNKVQALRVNWAKDNAFVQRIDYTYQDGKLVEEMTSKQEEGHKAGDTRTTYTYLPGDKVESITWEWNTTKNDWGQKGGQRYIDSYTDFTGKADLAPMARVNLVEGAVGDVEVQFYVAPDAAAANARYDVYRDGARIDSKTVNELDAAGMYNSEGMAACYELSRQPAGQHDYYVQMLMPDSQGNYVAYYVSDVTPIDIALTLPAVENLKVANIEMKTTQGVDQYNITLTWDNPANIGELGFKRHNFFIDSYKSRYAVTESAGATTFKLENIEEPKGTVKIITDYEQGSAESATIPYDYADFTAATGVDAWGWMSGSMNPYLAKINVNDPSADYDKVWDLEQTNDYVWEMYWGAPVGNTYYGMYANENYEYVFANFNFAEQTVTDVCELTWGTDACNLSDMAYDEATQTVYGVSYTFDEETNAQTGLLMTIEPDKGVFTTVATMDKYIEFIAAINGKLYGMASPDYQTWQLYEINPDTGTLNEIVFPQTLNAESSDTRSLTAYEGKLYLTVGTTFFTIDPVAKTFTQNSNLKKGVNGLTFVYSNETPEITPVGPAGNELGRTLVTKTIYGDAMGMISDNIATAKESSFYNAQGNLSRLVETVSDDGENWTVKNVNRYNYNDEGQLQSIVRDQLGNYDYGMPAFKTIDTKTYTYEDFGYGVFVREDDSDGNWNERLMQNDKLIQETIGYGDENNEDIYQVLTYTYCEEGAAQGKVLTCTSASPNHPDWDGNIYCDFYEYNDEGQLVKMTRYATESMETVRDYTTYAYFDGTSILRSKEKFEADGTPSTRSTYTPVTEGDYNDLMLTEESCWDGQWIKETSGKTQLTYADFSALPDDDTVLNVTPNPDELNTANVAFSIPSWAYMGTPFRFDIYRDGAKIAELTTTEYFDGENMVYPDKEVRNGTHEYFVHPCQGEADWESGDILGWDGLRISNVDAINFDLALPAVTDLNVSNEREEQASGEGGTYDATFVTLSWTNPADAETYKFESNNVFLNQWQLPMATVTEGNQADVNIGEDPAKVTMFVQSRYAYGYANSETVEYEVGTVGIDGNYATDGLSINVANKVATLNMAASIYVFDMAGRCVASSNASAIDLRDLNGAYIITATAGDSKLAVKVML